MKFGGRGNLTLFNVQGDIERDIKVLSTERMLEKLGLAKSENKKVQSFSIPVIPSQEDYFLFPFRHLSATVVGGGTYKATDFSSKGVLKSSTKLLEGKPAYLNHNQMVGKEIGVVGECEYVEAYKHPRGLMVPAGIEGPFMLDSKIDGNGDLIRKLSAPISPIQSCSVSVIFEWEASHDFEREGDFFWHLGEEIDGTMVRRIVGSISDYAESSMVWLGADPYAKMLDEKGKLINIDRSAAFAKEKFSESNDSQKFDRDRKFFVFDCLDTQKFLHLSASSEKFNRKEPQNLTNMNEELLIFLASLFATTPDKIKSGEFKKEHAEKFVVKSADSFAKMKSEEDYTKLANDKKVADDALAALKLEKTQVDGELVTLKADKAKLEPLSKVGENVLALAKTEAKRVYGIFAKGKEDKTITDELEAETDYLKLEAKIKLFGGQAVTEFGGKCAACGSKEINFRSSTSKEGDPKNETTEDDSLDRAIHN